MIFGLLIKKLGGWGYGTMLEPFWLQELDYNRTYLAPKIH